MKAQPPPRDPAHIAIVSVTNEVCSGAASRAYDHSGIVDYVAGIRGASYVT